MMVVAMHAFNLRYVVLRHEGIPEPHFDLMFETSPGSALATWRTTDWPPRSDVPLVRLADHRASYLTYQGPISGDRGVVRRVASGSCELSGADSGQWTVRFDNGGVLWLIARGEEDLWDAQALDLPSGA